MRTLRRSALSRPRAGAGGGRGRDVPPCRLALRTCLSVLVVVFTAVLLAPGIHLPSHLATTRSSRVNDSLASPTALPLKVNLTASPASFVLGNGTYLTASVTDAVGNLSFLWSPLPFGCASANLSSLECVPTEAGRFNVTVLVSDPTQRPASAATIVVVDPSNSGSGGSGSVSGGASPPWSSVLLFGGLIGVAAAFVTSSVFVITWRRRLRRTPVSPVPPRPYVPPPKQE